MSIDDIDLDRVVTDVDYRRQVIEFLNGSAGSPVSDDQTSAEAG